MWQRPHIKRLFEVVQDHLGLGEQEKYNREILEKFLQLYDDFEVDKDRLTRERKKANAQLKLDIESGVLPYSVISGHQEKVKNQ